MKNFIYSFSGIFVAMDIVGILPLYLGMTQSMSDKNRRRIVKLSVLVAMGVAMAFVGVGGGIFKFLGVALWDFKVGGGIVLLVMSILDLVRSKSEEVHNGSTGVVPLAVPLITGPGVITTVMLQIGLYGHAVVVASLCANFIFAWIVLRNGHFITRIIGKEGTDIISKIAALFMTAIAFSMIRTGILSSISGS